MSLEKPRSRLDWPAVLTMSSVSALVCVAVFLFILAMRYWNDEVAAIIVRSNLSDIGKAAVVLFTAAFLATAGWMLLLMFQEEQK